MNPYTDFDVYMESLMSYREAQGMLDTARAESEQIGEHKMQIEVVLNGIQLGLSDETIHQLTGLSLDEISKLRNGG